MRKSVQLLHRWDLVGPEKKMCSCRSSGHKVERQPSLDQPAALGWCFPIKHTQKGVSRGDWEAEVPLSWRTFPCLH